MKTKAEVLFEIDSALEAQRVMLRYHKSHWHKARSHQWDILWMTRAELAQAIPPAYTEFIGMALYHYLTCQEALQ